jgi:RNA polymerase sigma factor (sigma-70 family)
MLQAPRAETARGRPLQVRTRLIARDWRISKTVDRMAQSSLLNVFQEHRNELLAYMAARLRCPFTAHDLVQELFLKIFALERSGEIANGKAYVFRMAANLVIDHQRRTSRQGALLAQAASYLRGTDDVPSPERQAMAQEELRGLAATVERLSPTTRRIFKRNRFEGRTQREIAAELGISQTAVEKHIRKALAALAAHRQRP